MKKKLFIILFCLLILTSCKDESPSPTPTPSVASPTPSPTATPTPTPVVSKAPVLTKNDLTGLEIENPSARPVAVMMNNIRAALPMHGISQADIIYECLAEGGITRMLAVFKDISKAGDIGTIRSTRTYYLELALGHEALLLHAGGSYLAYNDMKKWKMQTLDGVNDGSISSMFWRDPDRRKRAGYEHSLFSSGDRIISTIEKKGIRMEYEESFALGWSFNSVPIFPNAKPAAKVSVPFTSNKTTTFDYDSDEKIYLVSQYNGAFNDGASNTQVSAANVVVIYTDVSVIPGDSEGRLKTRLTGSGTGHFAARGVYVPIKWSKDSYNSPFVFTLEDGNSFSFSEGKSYICVVPKERTAVFS